MMVKASFESIMRFRLITMMKISVPIGSIMMAKVQMVSTTNYDAADWINHDHQVGSIMIVKLDHDGKDEIN